MPSEIIESLHDYFEMVPARTDALKEAVFRLRYQVYCLEMGVFESTRYRDGLERDEYDSHSEHYLIRHRESGVFAATTRLILADPTNTNRPFPIERHCQLQRSDLLANVPRNRLAEVSRFCVSKHFKRRPGEQGTIAGTGFERKHHYLASEDERRIWPHLTLALIACLHRINAQHDTTHWYALIEPSLFRLLNFLGISFTAIGPYVDFHGKRQPCIIQVPQYLDRVKKKNRDVWNMLTDYGSFWRESSDAVRANSVTMNLNIHLDHLSQRASHTVPHPSKSPQAPNHQASKANVYAERSKTYSPTPLSKTSAR